jgi:hypothetical protein
MLRTLKYLVKSVLETIQWFCTLNGWKDDVGGKEKLVPTIIVKVLTEGIPKEVIFYPQDESGQFDVSAWVEYYLSVGSK